MGKGKLLWWYSVWGMGGSGWNEMSVGCGISPLAPLRELCLTNARHHFNGRCGGIFKGRERGHAVLQLQIGYFMMGRKDEHLSHAINSSAYESRYVVRVQHRGSPTGLYRKSFCFPCASQAQTVLQLGSLTPTKWGSWFWVQLFSKQSVAILSIPAC